MEKGPAVTLGAAADLYLRSLAQGKAEAQPELLKLLRWFGRERALGQLTPPELETYGEGAASGGTGSERHIKVVRAFLAFAQRKGLVSTNLATHVRARRAPGRRPDPGPGQREPTPLQLTAQGRQELEEQLARLQEEAVRAAAEIKKAAADKDVRENAPLETAREHQGQITSRIQEIQAVLERAQVMQEESSGEPARSVRQGSRVTLQDLATGEVVTYLLVDPREANLSNGKLSISSPVGQAALERRAGQELVVTAPKGTLRYSIVKVE